MKNLLILAIVLFNLNCFGQTYSPNDFTLFPIPKVHDKAWLQLDTSKSKTFAVSIINGQLQIVENHSSSEGKEYALPEGKLLALDLGEWGDGGLYYQPNNTAKKSFYIDGILTNVDFTFGIFRMGQLDDLIAKLIKGKYLTLGNGNTQAVVPYKDGWLFTQGFPNDYGSLSKLSAHEDSFTVSKVFDLKAAPTAIAVYKDWIFITTYNGFYSIHEGNKELIFDSLFWQGLNPNSIAALNDRTIYVGLYDGYAQIDLIKKDLKFYRYNK